MEPAKPTRKKRSTNIHKNQIFHSAMHHEKVDDITHDDLVAISERASVRQLCIPANESEDYVPFEQIPILERQQTLDFLSTEIVHIMKKRTQFESKFDMEPKVAERHFHHDIVCPYKDFFLCDENGNVKEFETCSKTPTHILNENQKKYLQNMKNYNAFQKFILPRMRKIHQKTSYSFESLSQALRKECGNISFVNATLENGYLVCCARMDLKLDLIFICIVIKTDGFLGDIFEGKETKIIFRQLDEMKLKKLNALGITARNFFYFSCGCDSASNTEKEDVLDIYNL